MTVKTHKTIWPYILGGGLEVDKIHC